MVKNTALYKKICGMLTNEIIIQQSSKVDISNYKQPYGLRQ